MRVEKASNQSIDLRSSKVDVNHLIEKVKQEEKKSRRANIAVSAAAVSALAVFGIILTL